MHQSSNELIEQIISRGSKRCVNERLKTPVTPRDLGLVARHIGMGFEYIGIELGLSVVAIQQGRVAHPCSMYMQIFIILTKWKQWNGSSATYLDLVKALWTCKERCTIEWEDILNILQ
ncbi:uncharacterized protein LOC125381047 [Haliotis rufescens]|uniref:uncharacterized protein LOC125381047 n=1 Tax=Haliotis rufescens TaxID=6454 RepID=UPI00201F89B5|nr:uncharacterized protein LOC125381047 [Haliotis rufescens]